MLEFISNMFNNSFASRWAGGCSGWTKELVLSHVVADMLIWLAYMVIPVILLFLLRARRDIPFNFFFFLFAVFIIGCGFTHFVGAITPFYPYYYLDFWVKSITALASIGTAIVLIMAYPKIVALPNPYETLEIAKKANKDLEMLTEVLHKCQDSILITNKDGEISFWNEAAVKTFLWEFSEVCGLRLEKTIIPNQHIAAYTSGLEKINKGEKLFKPFKISTSGVTKEGKEIPVSVSVFKLTEDRYCGIIRDISEMEKTNKELASANKELENFALIAAHDLQDPLKQNVVLLKLIMAGKHELIESTLENNYRMQLFVKKLLDYARSGSATLDVQSGISVSKIIKNVIADLNARVVETGTMIEVGEMPVLNCDPVQLGRVFQNLIANAMKNPLSNRQLLIEIDSRKIEDFWEFSVVDNGTGISELQLKTLFSIYRGKKNDRTGVGFGLAVCKRIVESHKGKIEVESTEGIGTKFVFTIGENLPVGFTRY